MPEHRDSRGASQATRCLFELGDRRLVIALEDRGRIIDRLTFNDVGRAQLDRLLAEHRSAFEGTWHADPFDAWTSATERFLTEVDHLISARLRPLLVPHHRVALELDDSTIARLPVETAHRRGGPALFELLSIYRSGGRHEPAGSIEPRAFAVDVARGCVTGLRGVVAEEALVHSVHRPDRVHSSERLIHVIGHRPTSDRIRLLPSERAHLVLSGCDSLPQTLPDGAASATGTLWPVDDQTNATTVSLFHSRIAIGVGPVEALRQTQLLQRCMPPVVWAAYAHIGQPD